MHLTELLAHRAIPTAGLFVSLTRRCPLSCAHCSTSSSPQSEEQDERPLLSFLRTFTVCDRPDYLLLTGGEPLLRPKLVFEIIDLAHAVGSKVSVSSGMFFATGGRLPSRILRAISKADHLIASLDAYHERYVRRCDVLSVLSQIIESGVDVSLHIVGTGPDDPYIEHAVADARKALKDRAPMLVATLQPTGRAVKLIARVSRTVPDVDMEPTPCALAAWPVITFDGAIVGCCNQHVVDGPAPAHLDLGNITNSSWYEVQRKHASSGIGKALRVFGPRYLAARFGTPRSACDGYCETCWKLSDNAAAASQIEGMASRPSIDVMERVMGSLVSQPPLDGVMSQYAQLVHLGSNDEWKERTPCV